MSMNIFETYLENVPRSIVCSLSLEYIKQALKDWDEKLSKEVVEGCQCSNCLAASILFGEKDVNETFKGAAQ